MKPVVDMGGSAVAQILLSPLFKRMCFMSHEVSIRHSGVRFFPSTWDAALLQSGQVTCQKYMGVSHSWRFPKMRDNIGLYEDNGKQNGNYYLRFGVKGILRVSHNCGYLFGGPQNKDHSILGSPCFGKLPY